MEGYIANIITSFSEIPEHICSSVFMSGCSFNCTGCQNKELQSPIYGKKMSVEEVVNEVNNNQLTSWVCFLGGEPFYQTEFLHNMCTQIQKPIGIYSGNDFNIISDKYSHIISLQNVKFLKTGRYIKELTVEHEFPITSNQEVYLKKDNNWQLCNIRHFSLVSRFMD